MKFPYLRDDDIEAAAKQLLAAAFGEVDRITYPVDLDVLLFDHLCERHDLIFNDEQDLGQRDGEEILGVMRPFDNAILISAAVKREGPLGRFRFTVGHEVGHWVLHRPMFLATAGQHELFDTSSSTRTSLVSLNRNVFPGRPSQALPPEEWQANRFAVALLLDERILRDAFVERFGEPPLHHRYGVGAARGFALRHLARTAASQRVGGLVALQDVFGLSTEAMAIALESRGYVAETSPFA